MNSQNIVGQTRVMTPPEDMTADQCNSLPILDQKDTDGANWMISAWLPTPEELVLLQAGKPIYLWIRGVRHPVVALQVD